jgi:hypothetical protein
VWTYEVGEVLLAEPARSAVTLFSAEAGEPLLRALFAEGCSALGGPEAALGEGAMAANCRGEAMRSTEGARGVGAGGAATTVVMAELGGGQLSTAG